MDADRETLLADVRQLRNENAWLRERHDEMVRAAESFRADVIAEVADLLDGESVPRHIIEKVRALPPERS